MTTTLRFKRLRANAVTPRRAHPTDAGLDLAPIEDARIAPGVTVKLPTGLAFEIPQGCKGQIDERSSTGARGLLIRGVVDADYRGDVHLRITNISNEWLTVEREKYIAQLVIVPVLTPETVEVSELSSTERGDGGFGSSDVKP